MYRLFINSFKHIAEIDRKFRSPFLSLSLAGVICTASAYAQMGSLSLQKEAAVDSQRSRASLATAPADAALAVSTW